MLPLFSSEQVKQADKYAIEELEIPGIVLMENASRSIFDVIERELNDIPGTMFVGIICGPGNNGGDGFALARHFINRGHIVSVITTSDDEKYKGDAKTNYQILLSMYEDHDNFEIIKFEDDRIEEIEDLFDDSDILIDAMLGTGTKGELRQPYKTIVGMANESPAFRIAVDIPTGLDVDKGSGGEVFRADLTITLGAFKPGLFFGKGYGNSGKVEMGYIGIGESYFKDLEPEAYAVEPEDALLGLPLRSPSSHKYSVGKTLVIAGSGNYPGAAAFTANSVISSGGGSSILAYPASVKGAVQQKLESAILLAYNDEGTEYLQEKNIDEISGRIEWADVIALGPGLGREEETQKAVLKLLNKYPGKRMVIDADAIYALTNNRYKFADLTDKTLTPHYKEFSELIGISIEELGKDILGYGKKFAVETKSYLVLKGAPTITFTPSGEALINSTGNSGMSSFGIGDVLTGIISSFIAQHEPESLEEAVVSAVYLHSLSADILLDKKTVYGITAGEVLNNFGNAVRFLRESIIPGSGKK